MITKQSAYSGSCDEEQDEMAQYDKPGSLTEDARMQTRKKTMAFVGHTDERAAFEALKRAFDLLFSLLLLIALSPVFLLIAVAIVIDDPKGGSFFAQKRCGKNGVLFSCYKFRSMVIGAEDMLPELQNANEADGPVFKIKNDPRITKVGHFIRKFSLDELPQLFNILKGDMSFVGPRPPLPNEVACYTSYQWRRLLVRPGLTCYWQVSAKRHTMPFDEWVALDMQYIHERNVWIDLKLIFMTVLVMLKHEGE